MAEIAIVQASPRNENWGNNRELEGVGFGTSEERLVAGRLVAIVFLRRGAGRGSGVMGGAVGPVAKTSLIGHLNR